VTPLLASRNRLEVVLDAENGVLGEVALEIRREAFLRGVVAHVADGTIRVTGKTVGQSTQPLELYVMAAGRNVAYTVVEARAEGRSFEVSFPTDAPVQEVRVELVHVAECWYAVLAAVATA
jgi:hypothetical protein